MIVDYNRSILSYIASIRNYLGLDSSYEADKDFYNYINSRKPEKVFLLLVDAMGISIIEKLLPEDSFIRNNLKYTTNTVLPSTTTAATTSIRNGKAPIENAWIGWCQYLKEVDDIIIPFKSCGFYNDKTYETDIFNRYVPVSATDIELNQKGIRATTINPSFDPNGCKSFIEMCDRLLKYSNNNEYRYIYAYWDQLDSIMHEKGTKSIEARNHILEIDNHLKRLYENKSEDTMIVVIADHGQIDITRYYDLYKSEYDKYFYRYPALEYRFVTLYVKDEYKDIFEKQFKEEFKDDYLLLNKKDTLDLNIFGDRNMHPLFEEFIGEYIAIAKSDMSFRYSVYKKQHFIGSHAGMTKDELMIPIIVL